MTLQYSQLFMMLMLQEMSLIMIRKKYQTGRKYNWKKQFNIDLNKLAQEVTFSGKTLKPTNSQFTSITHWAYFTKEK